MQKIFILVMFMVNGDSAISFKVDKRGQTKGRIFRDNHIKGVVSCSSLKISMVFCAYFSSK